MAKKLTRVTIEEAVAQGFGSDAAAAPAKACPTFTLRADRPGHLRALMAAGQAFALLHHRDDAQSALHLVREFEM